MSPIEIRPVSRKTDLVIQEFDEEILIYDLASNKAFALNKSSALVWQACDGINSVSEISAKITKKLNSPVSEDFVLFALEQLKKDNLLENALAISDNFNGLSRRQVIRKVGFASLVALPVISSLIAPTAAFAQSACSASSNKPNGCVCSSAASCNSGCCSSTSPKVCTSTKASNSGSCGFNCECASGCCAGSPGTCFANKALAAGQSCITSCQCINACSGGICT